MKPQIRFFCTLFCMIFLAGMAGAQTLSYSPKTGDLTFDAQLQNLNIEARADLDGYLNDLAKKHNVPLKELKRMIDKVKMEPADLYLAIHISDLSGSSLTEVENEYKQNKDRGWGVMARNLGIKPGSPEFHELKQMTKRRGGGPPHKKGKHGHGKNGDDDGHDHKKGHHPHGRP